MKTLEQTLPAAPSAPTASSDEPTLAKAIGELIYLRPLILVVPMTLAGLLAAGPLEPLRALLAIALMALLDAGANVINHHSDWDIDKMNQKRTAMHAVFTKRTLIGVYLGVLVAVSLLLYALSANLLLIATAATGVALGALYSFGPMLKDKTPWNYASLAMAYGAVAFCVGLFTQASDSEQGLEQGLELILRWLPVVVAAFLFDFGFSITKDYVDCEGDRHFGKKTLPVMLGKAKSLAVQAAIIAGAYLLLGAALLVGWVPMTYGLFFLSLPVALTMLYKVHASDEKEALKRAFYLASYNGLFIRVLLLGVVLLGVSQAG